MTSTVWPEITIVSVSLGAAGNLFSLKSWYLSQPRYCRESFLSQIMSISVSLGAAGILFSLKSVISQSAFVLLRIFFLSNYLSLSQLCSPRSSVVM